MNSNVYYLPTSSVATRLNDIFELLCWNECSIVRKTVKKMKFQISISMQYAKSRRSRRMVSLNWIIELIGRNKKKGEKYYRQANEVTSLSYPNCWLAMKINLSNDLQFYSNDANELIESRKKRERTGNIYLLNENNNYEFINFQLNISFSAEAHAYNCSSPVVGGCGKRQTIKWSLHAILKMTQIFFPFVVINGRR